ncbi:hypothetical protein KQX54_019800 [Cotesia glomerata]|uniref:RRM domain-containing protein n=1 Tax=Cotesia glomerata TaxID=32391 RepID=A0AAV7J0U0_COTGL|nr:hypothetical protein KQX54_019800 [Cotesia glomerata]
MERAGAERRAPYSIRAFIETNGPVCPPLGRQSPRARLLTFCLFHPFPPSELSHGSAKITYSSSSQRTQTLKSLREYFTKYGDITEVMVMKDPTTRRSR